MSLQPVLFEVRHELSGWDLLWLRLRLVSDEEERLALLRREVAEVARANFGGESLASHPGVAAVRALFRAAGCDPTRYRPSSEALIRRLLKGPITDSERVRVTKGTDRAWMVVYLPQGKIDPEDARRRLEELLHTAPVAAVELFGVSKN